MRDLHRFPHAIRAVRYVATDANPGQILLVRPTG
jgi:hypothetical protein